jgi:rubrerythrin
MVLDGPLPDETSSVGEVLSFAIAKEVAAAERYLALADQVNDPALADVLRAIASQEVAHRVRLEAIAAGDLTVFDLNRFEPTPESEVTPVAEPGPDATLVHVLLYAINAEHDAFQLYMGLANAAADPGMATLFRTLASEESGHRTRLDRLYRTVAFGDV